MSIRIFPLVNLKKSDSLDKALKFFLAFFYSDITNLSKFKTFSLATDSNFNSILSHICVFLMLAQKSSRLWQAWNHKIVFTWFSFIELQSNHSNTKFSSCSNLSTKESKLESKAWKIVLFQKYFFGRVNQVVSININPNLWG